MKLFLYCGEILLIVLMNWGEIRLILLIKLFLYCGELRWGEIRLIVLMNFMAKCRILSLG